MSLSPSSADALGWVMCAMFLSIALILGGAVAWVGSQNLHVMRHHDRVVGEVVDLRWPPGRAKGERVGKGETFSVVVRFRWRGYTKHSDFESHHAGWEVGEPVALFVDPERPWKTTPDSVYELWFIPTALGIPALLFLIYGLRMARELRRESAGRRRDSAGR